MGTRVNSVVEQASRYMQLTVMPLPLLVIDVTAALLRRIYQNVAFYYQIPLPQVLQIPDVLWKMFPAEISGFRVLYPTFSSSTINTWDSQVAGSLEFEGLRYLDTPLPLFYEDSQPGTLLTPAVGNTWSRRCTPCGVYNRAIYLCLYSLLPVEVAIVMWGYVQTPQPTFREIVEMAITLVWGYRQRRSRIHRVRYFCLARSYNLLLTGNQDQFRVRLSSYIPNNLLDLVGLFLNSHLNAALGINFYSNLIAVIIERFSGEARNVGVSFVSLDSEQLTATPSKLVSLQINNLQFDLYFLGQRLLDPAMANAYLALTQEQVAESLSWGMRVIRRFRDQNFQERRFTRSLQPLQMMGLQTAECIIGSQVSKRIVQYHHRLMLTLAAALQIAAGYVPIIQ